VLSIQGTGIPIYAVEMQSGLNKGVADQQSRYPLVAKFVGPVDTNAQQQVAELQTLLNAGQIDCLGVQSPGPEGFVPLFDQVAAAGVPAFAVNTDVSAAKRLAYWALNEKATGSKLADLAADAIQQQNLSVSKAVLFSSFPQAPWALDRMTGFKAELQQKLPNVTVVNDPSSAIDTTGDFAKTHQVTDAYIRGNPSVNLIFHTDQGVEEVGATIKAVGKTGKVFAVGMNVSPKIFDLVDQGIILDTINQRWDLQTARLAKECLDFLLTDKVYDNPIQYMDPAPLTKATLADQKALWTSLHPAA
jgi:ribose transport system substrate-binding protein